MPSRRFRPAPSGVAAALLGASYAGYASGTTPFTWTANFMVAVPIVLVLAGLAVRWRRWATVPRAVPEGWWPWAAVLGAVLLWELVNYLAVPRSTHPTLSSLSDRAMQWRAAKAALILCWLWIGVALVRPK
jgi:hypothetical protein